MLPVGGYYCSQEPLYQPSVKFMSWCSLLQPGSTYSTARSKPWSAASRGDAAGLARATLHACNACSPATGDPLLCSCQLYCTASCGSQQLCNSSLLRTGTRSLCWWLAGAGLLGSPRPHIRQQLADEVLKVRQATLRMQAVVCQAHARAA
jgi:hypothetical protein